VVLRSALNVKPFCQVMMLALSRKGLPGTRVFALGSFLGRAGRLHYSLLMQLSLCGGFGLVGTARHGTCVSVMLL